jgi:hypothetical protein
MPPNNRRFGKAFWTCTELSEPPARRRCEPETVRDVSPGRYAAARLQGHTAGAFAVSIARCQRRPPAAAARIPAPRPTCSASRAGAARRARAGQHEGEHAGIRSSQPGRRAWSRASGCPAAAPRGPAGRSGSDRGAGSDGDAKRDHGAGEVQHVAVVVGQAPVDPGQLVVWQ